jgi:hypothetical protein
MLFFLARKEFHEELGIDYPEEMFEYMYSFSHSSVLNGGIAFISYRFR